MVFKNKYSFKKCITIFITSIPAIFGQLFEMFVEIANMFFVGHLNDSVALASVGLGNMVINVTSYSIGIGLNSALDTLVTQAYGCSVNFTPPCPPNIKEILS